jgi:hypothetical protein
MATPTYTLLDSVTLGSSASSVTFSSITQDYRDLVLVAAPLYSGNSDLYLRLNGDTGSNYSNVSMTGNGSTASSLASSGDTIILTTTYFGTTASNYVIQVMDYSATDKHKTVLTRSNRADVSVSANASRWASTSAVTSFTFFPGGGFVAGSSFYLYGIASEVI